MSRIYREVEGIQIKGTCLHAFIHNCGRYHLADVEIYADGQIACWGWMDFEEFKKKVRSKWIVTQIPDGAPVSMEPQSMFIATDVRSFVEPEEFVKEVAEEIERLNSRPTAVEKCNKAYEDFSREPSELIRQDLKAAYEAIPKHLRRLSLGDMDTKDGPVRAIIYGEDKV